MHAIWPLIYIKFVSERNLFFEQREAIFSRFAFLVNNKRFRNAWYLVFFMVSPQITATLLPVILAVASRQEIFVIIFGFLWVINAFFSRADPLEWKLFDRRDVIAAFPNAKERFLVVFFRNLVLMLIVRNSPLIIFIVACLVLEIPVLSMVSLLLSLVLLFMVREGHSFTVRYATVLWKKAASWIQYLLEALAVTVGIVVLVEAVIAVVTGAGAEISGGTHLLDYCARLAVDVVDALGVFLTRTSGVIFGACLLFALLCSIAVAYGVRRFLLHDRAVLDEVRYSNFAFIRGAISLFGGRRESLGHSLVLKEYGLFAHLYHYNFRDYPQVLIGEAIYFAIITLSYFLVKYPSAWGPAIFCVEVFLILFLELAYRGLKSLAAHLSFAADYGTVRVFNAGNYDLNVLLRAKLKFFYSTLLIFIPLFFIIFNICGIIVGISLPLLIFMNLACAALVTLLPSLLLTGNIMLRRMDYPTVEALVTDDSMALLTTKGFRPLKFFYDIDIVSFLILLGIYSFFPSLPLSAEVLGFFLGGKIVYFVLLALLMNRIRDNMLAEIAQGNYSADFMRVFGKNSSVKRFFRRWG